MTPCPACGYSNPPDANACQACDAPLQPVGEAAERASEDLESVIHALLEQDQKIEAIRVYREATGAGLKEAKDAVEALAGGTALPDRSSVDPAQETELLELLKKGQKIQAIKRFRELTGSGLKDANDAVTELAVRHGLSKAGGGCAGAVLLLLSGALSAGLLYLAVG